MGRSLPWKKTARDAGGTTATSSSTPTAATTTTAPASASISPSPSPSPVVPSSSRPRPSSAATSKAPVARTRIDRGRDRAPFSSPPPQQPVPEDLMIPGLHNDDGYRMVEDEFVATAHRFTAPVHAAEYHRLKDMAKKQKENGPTFSLPPITPDMTDDVKRSHMAKRLAISQHAAIKTAFSRVKDADEQDLDDPPWAGTHLHHIMENPRKKQVPLSRLAPVVTGTRAAALSRSQDDSQPERSQSRRGTAEHRSADARHPQRGTGADTTRPTNDASKSSASQADRPIKQAPMATPGNVDDGSDSSTENDFLRRIRERRNEQASASRTKSATPDASSQATLPSQNERRSRTSTSKTLSIPSI